MRIRPHHRKTAKEFKQWLKENPNATHGEIFKALDEIADRNSYMANQAKLLSRQ